MSSNLPIWVKKWFNNRWVICHDESRNVLIMGQVICHDESRNGLITGQVICHNELRNGLISGQVICNAN